MLAEVASQKQLNELIRSMATDEERKAIADGASKAGDSFVTAAISYVGKANFAAEEKYTRCTSIRNSRYEVTLV